jgi:hypothetical protein
MGSKLDHTWKKRHRIQGERVVRMQFGQMPRAVADDGTA